MSSASVLRMDAKYRKIVKAIRRGILRGEYQPGHLLPSQRELMEMFAVSRITAIKAVDELKRLGLITVEHGRGTYVTFSPQARKHESVHKFALMLKEAGIAHSVENDEVEGPIITIPFDDREEITVQADDRYDLCAERVTWSQPAGEPTGHSETPLYAADDLDGLLVAVRSTIAKMNVEFTMERLRKADSALFAHQDEEAAREESANG